MDAQETWVLFVIQGEKPTDLRVELVDHMTPKRVYWVSGTRLLHHPRGRIVGFFPSYEAAEDAKAASRLAYRRAYEAGESGLIWAWAAIKESPGYRAEA